MKTNIYLKGRVYTHTNTYASSKRGLMLQHCTTTQALQKLFLSKGVLKKFRESKTERAPPTVSSYSPMLHQPGLVHAAARSPENSNQVSHSGGRGPRTWIICCFLPRHTTRELERKHNSWALNQYSDTECRNDVLQFYLLGHNTGPLTSEFFLVFLFFKYFLQFCIFPLF